MPRGIVARIPFEKPDVERTRAAQSRAAAQVRVVYSQDKSPVVRLRDGLKNRAAEIAAADTLAAVSRDAWLEFAPESAEALEAIPIQANAATAREPPVAPEPPGDPADEIAEGKEPASAPASAEEPSDKETTAEKLPPKIVVAAEEVFQKFRAQLDTKGKQLEFDKAIDRAFADVEKVGVLEKIQHGIDEGSQTEIDVHPLGNSGEMARVQVADALLGEAKVQLKARLEEVTRCLTALKCIPGLDSGVQSSC